MVKKIRVIEDSVSSDETTSEDRGMMELAKSMDWKLWEILLIMQKLEKSLKGMEITQSEDNGTILDTNTKKGSVK
jgi:hypothetical protein|tara:strand:- start:474 stop:698 length:225 start_codon:yes stop_codon:yes gene_type:complete